MHGWTDTVRNKGRNGLIIIPYSSIIFILYKIVLPVKEVIQQHSTVLPEMALPILWKTTHLSLAHINSDYFDAEGSTSRSTTLCCVCAPSFVTRDRFCASI